MHADAVFAGYYYAEPQADVAADNESSAARNQPISQAQFISAVDEAVKDKPLALPANRIRSRSHSIRSIRTTDYFLKDQARLKQDVQDDLNAVQSFWVVVSNCHLCRHYSLLWFARLDSLFWGFCLSFQASVHQRRLFCRYNIFTQ